MKPLRTDVLQTKYDPNGMKTVLNTFMSFSDICLPQDSFSQTSRLLNGITFRPHTPNLTQIDQGR